MIDKEQQHRNIRRTVAELMLAWEDTKRRLDELEEDISVYVQELGTTVVTGNVRATYRSGRKRYNYEAAARDATPDMVERHTAIRKRIDFRSICLDELQLTREEIPFEQGDPSVSIRIE